MAGEDQTGAGQGQGQQNAGGDQGQQGAGSNDQQKQEPAYTTFEDFLKTVPEGVKTLYDGHLRGLKTALESERTERGNLARQLKDLQGKAEKGSELEKTLGELQGQLEAVSKRAAFLEEAAKPDVGCINPKVAYQVAVAEDAFTRDGKPDWSRVREIAPELFKTATRESTPRGNAGTGTGAGGKQGKPASMNDFIRAAAGRG